MKMSFVLLSLVGLAGCGDPGSSPRWTAPPTTTTRTQVVGDGGTVAYGWTRPVTTDGFPGAAQKLGRAGSVLAGNSIRAIVTDPNVRVRGDNQACVTCHAWAGAISRETFCDRVSAFVAEPTSKGDDRDPESAKPLVLKDLLDRWEAAGCPD
jgi:hypothetical protein